MDKVLLDLVMFIQDQTTTPNIHYKSNKIKLKNLENITTRKTWDL